VNAGNDRVEIRRSSQLSPEEARRLFGWSDNIFGTAGLNLTNRSKDGVERFVLYAGDEGPLSHVGVLRHRGSANGLPALVGGIGGVVTIPDAQKRGYAALVVQHATEFLRREWNVDFALLFCVDRMVRYYERLGFQTVRCEVLVDQPAGKIPSPFNVMTLAFDPRFDVIERIDLASAPW
jgi:GNAT superfamily N-acetyltransferase